jgi:hypothetical protein
MMLDKPNKKVGTLFFLLYFFLKKKKVYFGDKATTSTPLYIYYIGALMSSSCLSNIGGCTPSRTPPLTLGLVINTVMDYVMGLRYGITLWDYVMGLRYGITLLLLFRVKVMDNV